MSIYNIAKSCALTLSLITSTYASNQMPLNNDTDFIQNATYIKLLPVENGSEKLAQFLQKGSQLVRQTEPKTLLWFALKAEDYFAIMDFFPNEEGRAKHFSGQVAKALQENASQLVDGGWENGVLANINNFDWVAVKQFNKEAVLRSKQVSYISFKAKPGKNKELELFLEQAAKLVDKTEPNTYFWVALKTKEGGYAIFDTFPDHKSREKHFSGQAAAKLKEKAEYFIEGGWEEGVLAHVHNFEIIAVS